MTGDDQVACVDVERPAEDADGFRRDARRLRQSRRGAGARSGTATCASQKPLTLLRGVTCQVTRPLAFSKVRSEYSRRPTSGAYSHCAGSPAFRL